MARKQWRCFHCDDVFRSAAAAREHFGSDQTADPACKMAAHQHHLVHYIRELEDRLDRYIAEDSDVLRAIMTLEADHAAALRREEEKGYERGLRDGMALPRSGAAA